MADNRYRVEYAASGRSKCKEVKCKGKIEKGAVRIAKLVKNPFDEEGDSLMPHWYHPACIFQALTRARKSTKKIESEDDIEDFDALKEEDQKMVRELITNPPAPAASKKRKRAPRKPKKEESEDEPEGENEEDAGEGLQAYLVADSSSGGKFWEIKVAGKSHTVRYGKVGASGRSSTKEFKDAAAATKAAEKLIAQKKKKGYEEASPEEEEKEEEAEAEPPKKKAKRAPRKKAMKEESEDEPEEDAGEGLQAYLVADSSSGGKFWEIKVAGKSHTVRYGKVGTSGRSSTKKFKDAAAATKAAEKLIAQKKKKGYEEASPDEEEKEKSEEEAEAEPPKEESEHEPEDEPEEDAGEGLQAYLVADSSSGGKFWEIKLAGNSHTVRYGKVGTSGRSATKKFKDAAAAKKAVEKLIEQKKKKGYEEADG